MAAPYNKASPILHTRLCFWLHLCAKLAQNAQIIVLNPFLGETAIIIVSEEVYEFERHRFSIRLDGSVSRGSKIMIECTRHICSRSYQVTMTEDLSSFALKVCKRRAHCCKK